MLYLFTCISVHVCVCVSVRVYIIIFSVCVCISIFSACVYTSISSDDLPIPRDAERVCARLYTVVYVLLVYS